MDVRHRPRGGGPVAAARGGRRDPAAPLAPDRGAAVAAACAETARIVDPHRAIDWLSTFPAVVELALAAPDGGRPARRARRPGAGAPGRRPRRELTAMRFQDAAKDARTVVYAGIQADPLVARLAAARRRRDLSRSGSWPAPS